MGYPFNVTLAGQWVKASLSNSQYTAKQRPLYFLFIYSLDPPTKQDKMFRTKGNKYIQFAGSKCFDKCWLNTSNSGMWTRQNPRAYSLLSLICSAGLFLCGLRKRIRHGKPINRQRTGHTWLKRETVHRGRGGRSTRERSQCSWWCRSSTAESVAVSRFKTKMTGGKNMAEKEKKHSF